VIRALATIVLLAAMPSVATAQIEVRSIAGRGGARLERELTRGLEQSSDATGGDPVGIVGRVRRRRGRFVLQLRIERAGSASHVRVAHRRPAGLVRAALRAIRTDLENSTSAAAPEPAPPETAPVEAEAAASTSEGPARLRARAAARPHEREDWPSADASLELRVGAGWMYRGMRFAGDLHDRVGAYELPAAGTLHAELRWFPAAHFTGDALAGLGVRGRASFAPGIESGTQDRQASFSSTVGGWRVGALYRLRVADALALEAQLDYGEEIFRLDPTVIAGPSSTPPPVPSVRYAYLRPGAAVEIAPIPELALRVGGGWRAVVASGDLGAWFPRSSTTGFDVTMSAEWRWSRWFATRLHATYARYVSDLNPLPGDRLVVGGASDDWATVGLDFVVRIPGVR